MSDRSIDVSEEERLEALTEVSRRRVVINATSNYGRYGLALLVNLFLQAYIIRTVGQADYSLWPIATTVASFITLVPLALTSGVRRYMAQAFTRKDLDELNKLTTSVFAITALGTLLYVLIVVAFSVYFERIFSIPAGTAGVGPWVMLLIGLGEGSKTLVSVFQGGLDAAQKFVAINAREIAILVLYGVLVVIVFNTVGPELVYAAAAYGFTQCLGAVVTWRVARRLLPWLKIRRQAFDWKSLRTVMSFSVWVIIGAASALLYWRTGNVVINKLLDPLLVTGYSVVVGILVQGYGLATYGSGVLFSAATVLFTKNDYQRLARMTYRASRVTTALAAPAIMFLAFFGRPVMTIYLGDDLYGEYGIYFAVLGVALIIQMTQIPSRTVPQAFAKLAVFNTVTTLVALTNVGLSIFLILVFDAGLMAVAASAALTIALHSMLFIPWYTGRLLQVSLLRHWVQSLVLPIAHCLPALAVIAVFWALGLGNTLPQLIGIIVTVVVVHVAYLVSFGLMPQDRKAVLDTLRKVARRPGRHS